jgi:hypothetical protein
MVASDLEPTWNLFSERAARSGVTKALGFSDRIRISPTKIGGIADYHLGWRKGSLLDRLATEKVSLSSALVRAAREARSAVGKISSDPIEESLDSITNTASSLGVSIHKDLQVMLDAQSATLSSGAISVHDGEGVPLRALGTGSLRLLISGLHRQVAEKSVLLIDEVEHGLEPHRILRLLHSLGVGQSMPTTQVFMTTHSPTVLKELSHSDLTVVRSAKGAPSTITHLPPDAQGALRAHPESFLASSALVCEGATEVGLVRGLDMFFQSQGKRSCLSYGASFIDAKGVSKLLKVSPVFQNAGYRTALLRDDDVKPDPLLENEFVSNGGVVFFWERGQKTESAIINALPDEAIAELLRTVADLIGEDLLISHIKSIDNRLDIRDFAGVVDQNKREVLVRASCNQSKAWFKQVGRMQIVAKMVIGPNLVGCDEEFCKKIETLFNWLTND